MSYLTIEIIGEENGRLTVKERLSEKHWDLPCLCEPLTATEIVEHWTPELDDFEKAVNVDYIDSVWNLVRDGGIWGYPDIEESFKRMDHGKWLLQNYDDVHNDIKSTLHIQGVRVIGQDGEVKMMRTLG